MGLRDRIRAAAVKHPRYRYRRVHMMLLHDGYQGNRNRVQRLWRLESLHAQRPKHRKLKNVRHPIVVRGRYPNHVWQSISSLMRRLTTDQSKS